MKQFPEFKPTIAVIAVGIVIVLLIAGLWSANQFYYTRRPLECQSTATARAMSAKATLEARATATAIAGAKVVRTTQDINVLDTSILGELDIEYPIRMSPESSDTAILAIYVPDFLVNVKPVTVARIQIPDSISPVIGELNSYKTTIFVTETMRAELSSPSLEVQELHPLQQYVNIYEVNKPTYWAWTIQAPNVLGRQIFTLKVYLNQDITPAWGGSFYVEVVELVPEPTESPTYTPTPTPLPPLTRVANQFIENFTAVFGAVLTFIAAMIGIYAQHNKTKDKIERLEKKITKLSREREERETLDREITRLKSIRWWQFWRK